MLCSIVLSPIEQKQQETIDKLPHHLQGDELEEYLRTYSLNFSHEVQQGHSLDLYTFGNYSYSNH